MSPGRRRVLAVIVPVGVLLATGALARRQTGSALDPTKTPMLSASETQKQAGEYMTRIRATETKVVKLQDHARTKKDMVKLNCVNDKLLQVRGHVTLAGRSLNQLDLAVARSDEGSRNHEYTRMTILFQKVVVLGTEAENCVGDEASYVGATQVRVDVDPNIPDEDPTQPGLPLPDVTRPPAASPFV